MRLRSLVSRDLLVFLLTVVGLIAGAVAYWSSGPEAASILWAVTIGVALVPLTLEVVRELMRRHTGVDLIALVAMVSALVFDETLAGAVVALMLSGGQLLEGYAERRARSELSRLIGRSPRFVDRLEEGEWRRIPVDAVVVGDQLMVKAGEVVPVDGLLRSDRAVLDESALTGEPLPVDHVKGQRIRSGILNAGATFEFQATAAARDSTYAGILRLVAQAQENRAPLIRLADRYAGWFLLFTLLIASLAALLSDESRRFVAVLVVATPCPLILAAPIAVISGVSQAARRGILVKGGGALEALAEARILLLDKTGTVTAGVPTVAEIITWGALTEETLLRLSASLDVVSPHVLASAIVDAARRRGLEISFPQETQEQFGDGICGRVEGHLIRVGRASYVLEGAAPPAELEALRDRSRADGSSLVFVAVDGALAGALRLHDPLRPDAQATIVSLRQLGLGPIILATGDDELFAERVGELLAVDRVLAELSPADKLAAVQREGRRGKTIMVGDGINDAPALAAADVGVAMGVRGATASSEAADIVLMADRLDRLVEGVEIARRSRAIAIQSILIGMLLSGIAMVFAALGFLAPVAGALLQEAIDVAVILNALRARNPGPMAGV